MDAQIEAEGHDAFSSVCFWGRLHVVVIAARAGPTG
jgi:hypothetical protein